MTPTHLTCTRSPRGTVKPHKPINVGEVLRALQGAGGLSQYRTRQPIGATRRAVARPAWCMGVAPSAIGFMAGAATPVRGLAMVAPVRSDMAIAMGVQTGLHASVLSAMNAQASYAAIMMDAQASFAGYIGQ